MDSGIHWILGIRSRLRWLFSFLFLIFDFIFLVYEFGDDITQYCDSDRVLVMCNHQSTADVPNLFAVLQSKGVATRKVCLF